MKDNNQRFPPAPAGPDATPESALRLIFGKRLKEIREERGLTQEELAQLLRSTKQVVSNYEIGKHAPSVVVAMEWARVLGISIDDLAGIDQPASSPAPVPSQLPLSVDEEELIRLFRSMNGAGRQTALSTVRGLAGNPKMQEEPFATKMA